MTLTREQLLEEIKKKRTMKNQINSIFNEYMNSPRAKRTDKCKIKSSKINNMGNHSYGHKCIIHKLEWINHKKIEDKCGVYREND